MIKFNKQDTASETVIKYIYFGLVIAILGLGGNFIYNTTKEIVKTKESIDATFDRMNKIETVRTTGSKRWDECIEYAMKTTGFEYYDSKKSCKISLIKNGLL